MIETPKRPAVDDIEMVGRGDELPDAPEPVDAPESAEAEQPGGIEQAEQAPKREQQQTVPHGAFAKERARRKETEAALARTREDFARLEERTNMLLQGRHPQQQQQEEQPQRLPGADDPIGAIEHLMRDAQERRQRDQEHQQATRQAAQQQEQFGRLVSTYRARAAEFAEETPDFVAAYQHLLTARDEELQEIGVYDPAERARQIQNEEMNVAAVALQQGVNPAQRLYQLAKRRGYQPASKPASSSARLDTVERGQARSRSLSNAEGSAAPGQITAQDLLRMTPDEFAAYERKNPKRFKQLMGG